MKTLVCTILIAWSAILADTPKPPAISAEQRARYWRRDSELSKAQRAAKDAESALKDAISDLVKTCGADHDVVIDAASGEPACQAKPTAEPSK